MPFQATLNPDLGIYSHHISNHLSTTDSVCPLPFSLSANKGITLCFLFLPVLRCFNSRSSSASRRIRKSRDQSLHATPPSLSQLATSFIKTKTKLSAYQYKIVYDILKWDFQLRKSRVGNSCCLFIEHKFSSRF